MTNEKFEQATLQILIANLQDPNTTPSFDNYSMNDIRDAVRMAVAVERTCEEYIHGKFS